MSQENVEIVRGGILATMDGDWDAALTRLHPDAEVRDFDIPDAGIYRGHEGWRTWLTGWSESWSDWRIEELDVRPAGVDHVIALFRMVTKGGGSGIQLERGDAIVYRLEAGLIVRMEYFNDQRKALEAVGLSE